MTTSKRKRILKVGDKCPICGDVMNEVEIDCRGKEERGEPLIKVLNCSCLHCGDLMCNCGNPCWSFF
jgi:hypothetical protein